MSESHKLLMSSLTHYYNSNPECITILKDIISGKSKISLRVLDWFVTHYSKNKHLIYFINEINNTYNTKVADITMRKFNVYIEYRAQLHSYTKFFFDSFRRHERVTFIDPQDNTTIETTVGQLNFFRWAYKNKVINYVLDHIDNIEKSMHEYQKSVKVISKENTIVNGSIFVTFD